MTSATTILTMLAMLWHAMVGCCAHHVHEDTSLSRVDSCQAVLVHGHSCDHHSHDDDGNRHDASQEDKSKDHSHSQGVCESSGCLFAMPDSDGQFRSLSKAIGCQPYFDTACFFPLTNQLSDSAIGQGRQRPRYQQGCCDLRLHHQLSKWLI